MKQIHVKHQIEVDPDNPAGKNLHTYTVTKVVNCSQPTIDTVLRDSQLEYYCESEEWTATIT